MNKSFATILTAIILTLIITGCEHDPAYVSVSPVDVYPSQKTLADETMIAVRTSTVLRPVYAMSTTDTGSEVTGDDSGIFYASGVVYRPMQDGSILEYKFTIFEEEPGTHSITVFHDGIMLSEACDSDIEFTSEPEEKVRAEMTTVKEIISLNLHKMVLKEK